MSSDPPLPSSFDGHSDFYNENRMDKLVRRLREEPLIPLGCILTCWALFGASRAIRSGDHAKTNSMFRRRIYAQAFTILAMAAGSMYWHEDREKRKEYDKLQAEKQRVEKREAWLRELEARDEEQKAMKAKMQKRRDRMRQDSEFPGSGNGVNSALERAEERGVLAAVRDLVRRR